MAMVDVDGSCQFSADSRPKSIGLVWGLAVAGAQSTFIKWTGWTLAITLVIMMAPWTMSWLLLLLLLRVSCYTHADGPIPDGDSPIQLTAKTRQLSVKCAIATSSRPLKKLEQVLTSNKNGFFARDFSRELDEWRCRGAPWATSWGH